MSFKVFHSSPVQGLSVIEPRFSLTHKRLWVYATKSPIMSAAFLSNLGGDLTCYVGKEIVENRSFIMERNPGLFDQRYLNKKGSIYMLPGDTFIENQTTWKEELVSDVAVPVLDEFKIDNVKDFLFRLKELNLLDIYLIPEDGLLYG